MLEYHSLLFGSGNELMDVLKSGFKISELLVLNEMLDLEKCD